MLRQGLVALGLVSLAACGGGGGNGGNPSPIENRAPFIGAIGTQTVAEGTTDVVMVTAADADGDAISFSLSGDDAALFSISGTGMITFNEAADYENPGDANTDNTYDITVTASDGSLSDDESFMVMIADVLEGRAVDGPIEGATVTLMSRSAGSMDAFAEVATTTTDANGRFTFDDIDNAAYDYKITTRGGTDTVTNKDLGDLTFIAKVPKGDSGASSTTNVNAITTVLSVVETEEEQQELLGKLGIDATPDELTNSDIWEGSEEGDEEAQDAQRVNSQLTTIINTVSTVVEESTDEQVDPTELVETVAQEIVEASESQSDTEIDLADAELVEDVITDTVADVDPEAEVAEEVVEAVSNAVASVNSVLGDENQDPTGDTAAGVAGAAQEDLQGSVGDVASGQTDVATFEEETDAGELLGDVPTEPDAPDYDGDGIPDAIDPDDDNDGTNDAADAFPLDETEQLDTDGDTIGNNADTDDDGDGVDDSADAYPLAANYSDTAFDVLNGDPMLVVDYDPATDSDVEQVVDGWTALYMGATLDTYEVFAVIEEPLNGQNIQNALNGGMFRTPILQVPLQAVPFASGTNMATGSISIMDSADSVAEGDVARSIMIDTVDLNWMADGEMAMIEMPPQTVEASYTTSDNLVLNVTVENLDSDFISISAGDGFDVPATIDLKLMTLIDRVKDLVPGFLTAGVYEMRIEVTGVPMVSSRRSGSVAPFNAVNVTFTVGE